MPHKLHLARLELLAAARRALAARYEANVAKLHADDVETAYAIAWDNTVDTMRDERGPLNVRTFAFAKMFAANMDMVADVPHEYGLRKGSN